jgi:RNase adaptor protein for sRNA GlmZ degradation
MKTIYQFGYRNSQPPEGFPTVDCRTIPNPWTRGDNASDEERKAKVRLDPRFESLVDHGVSLLESWDLIAVGCVFGKHRSGAVADEIAKRTGAEIVKV